MAVAFRSKRLFEVTSAPLRCRLLLGALLTCFTGVVPLVCTFSCLVFVFGLTSGDKHGELLNAAVPEEMPASESTKEQKPLWKWCWTTAAALTHICATPSANQVGRFANLTLIWCSAADSLSFPKQAAKPADLDPVTASSKIFEFHNGGCGCGALRN